MLQSTGAGESQPEAFFDAKKPAQVIVKNIKWISWESKVQKCASC